MSNTLLYKGYEGSIEYSREDDCLYGKELGIDKRHLITYEGSSIDELKADFEAGIDDYLIQSDRVVELPWLIIRGIQG